MDQKYQKFKISPKRKNPIGMSTDITWGIQKGARKAKTKKKKRRVPTFFFGFHEIHFSDFTDFRISLITQLTHRLKLPSERDFVSKNEPNRLTNGETPAKNVSQVQKQ
jgi:hypothetical protein